MLLQWQHFQPHLFSMPGFVHVLEKPFCKANPLVGKPFCRAYSSCRGALLQGSCGKALLQGLFGMHGKQLLSFSQHTLLCCFGLLACRKQKFHQLLFCLCCPAGLAQGDSCNELLAFTRARHMLQVPLVLPTANCYCVLVDEHFLSAGPAAAFVGTSAAGFLEASFAEGFFILLLPVAGLFMACSLQSFFRQGGGLPSKPGSFSLSILCSSEPSSCPSSLSSSDEEAHLLSCH